MNKQASDSPRTSSARERRAEQTRLEILEAARAVFDEVGYAKASMAAIAARAEVAVQTVYSSVGSKGHLLVALVDHIRSQARIPELDRDVLEATEPVEMFRIGARMPSDVLRLGADVFRLLRDVAPSEPEVAEVWAGVKATIREGVEAAVRRLDELGSLRPGVTVTSATDMIVSSTGVEAALSLLDLGWDHDQIGDLFERLGMAMVLRDEFLTPEDATS